MTTPYPLASAAVPDIGIGPTPVIAADKTLGSFSPHEGRIYVAYVDLPTRSNQPPIGNAGRQHRHLPELLR